MSASKPDSEGMKATATPREDFWRKVVSEQERSGLSVGPFCRQRQVSEPSFYYWRKRLAENHQVRFALVERDESSSSRPAGVELVLASGERLQIPAKVDAATLRTVLDVLRERS